MDKTPVAFRFRYPSGQVSSWQDEYPCEEALTIRKGCIVEEAYLEPNEWIPVSERVPERLREGTEHSATVLVAVYSSVWGLPPRWLVYADYYARHVDGSEGFSQFKPHYWRPLPSTSMLPIPEIK